LERRVGRRRNLLAVGEVLKLPLRRREIGVVLFARRVPDRMYEHAVAVADSRNDASGNVVLHRKDARRLEVPTVGFGPELRSRLDVDQLGVDTNGGATLADA